MTLDEVIRFGEQYDEIRVMAGDLLARHVAMIAKAVGVQEGALFISVGGSWANGRPWNPRRDSEDAFNVMASLRMSIDQGSGTVFAQHRTPDGHWINSPAIPFVDRDLADVYREAICLCAIKVGEHMQ